MTKRKKKQKTYVDADGNKIVKYFNGRNDFEIFKKMQEFEKEFEREKKSVASFKEVAEAWENEHFNEIEGGTRISYSPALKRAISAFGDHKINEVTALDVKKLIDKLVAKKYSAQTVRVQKIVLNLIYNYAVLNGYTEVNPVSVVYIPRNLPRQKRDMPSAEDINVVMNSFDKPFGEFAYTILFTGCRRGETLALQWKDIDFNKNTITVNKSVNYNGDNQNIPIISPHTKSEAGMRTIVMLDCLKNRLQSIKQEPEKFIFGGDTPPTKTSLRHKWQKYLKETGLSITPHQLRHAYATILYDAGIDVKSAQELMGHSNISLTQNIYTHISKNRREQTAESLNEYVNKLSGS